MTADARPLDNTSPAQYDPTRWLRRGVTIPGHVLAAVAVLATLPLLGAVAVALDVAFPRKMARTRSLAMGTVYLVCEAAGIVVAGALWARYRGWRRAPGAAYLEANFRLQCWWASTLFRSAARLFAWRVEVEGGDVAGRGPVLVFGRHVSVADNLLPAALVAAPYGLRLRWAINRSLLRDPCLDIVGHRLPNAFVRSGSAQRDRHVAAVAGLGAGLGPSDGVLVFPEGALFNPERRLRALEEIAADDDDLRATAARLQHLLPPRLGGALALLDAAPDADVVFMAHRGLERASSYRAFLAGSTVGTTVSVAFWRVSRREVPLGREVRTRWFLARWEEMDCWVGQREPGAPPTRVRAGAKRC